MRINVDFKDSNNDNYELPYCSFEGTPPSIGEEFSYYILDNWNYENPLKCYGTVIERFWEHTIFVNKQGKKTPRTICQIIVEIDHEKTRFEPIEYDELINRGLETNDH